MIKIITLIIMITETNNGNGDDRITMVVLK